MGSTAALAAALLLLVGCGSAAGDVVAETADNLEELRSGTLELTVSTTAAPDDEGERAEAGFELSGTFQLPEEGGLPIADLEYTDLGSDEPVTRGFISTGEAVFIEVDGRAYEVPPEQTQSLLGGSGDDVSPFEEADIEGWLVEPELTEGESLDGVEVDRVAGELDVVAALNDLFAIAQTFGPSAAFVQIEGEDAERVEAAVQSSHLELVSGAEDKLLRSLAIDVELGLDDEQEIAALLGPLAGANFAIDLTISGPNEPVDVEAPADPLPLEELTG